MSNIKKFLDLIEKGDTVIILSQENVVERLNELFESELIEFKDGNIFLTNKGKRFTPRDIVNLPKNYTNCYETGFL